MIYIATDEEKQELMAMGGKFARYAPHFKGPSTAEVAIKQILSVMNHATVEGGYGGMSVSQHGNKQWL